MKIKEITPVSDDMYPLYWTTSKEGIFKRPFASYGYKSGYTP